MSIPLTGGGPEQRADRAVGREGDVQVVCGDVCPVVPCGVRKAAALYSGDYCGGPGPSSFPVNEWGWLVTLALRLARRPVGLQDTEGRLPPRIGRAGPARGSGRQDVPLRD